MAMRADVVAGVNVTFTTGAVLGGRGRRRFRGSDRATGGRLTKRMLVPRRVNRRLTRFRGAENVHDRTLGNAGGRRNLDRCLAHGTFARFPGIRLARCQMVPFWTSKMYGHAVLPRFPRKF